MRNLYTAQAFILHKRPYRETSGLIDFFTTTHGLLRGVLRGAFQKKKETIGYLQPFTHLTITFVGEGDLKTIRTADPSGPAIKLMGKALYSGLYLNEILCYLLKQQMAFPVLFQSYVTSLEQLANGSDIEVVLRQFELNLLDELGYGLLLHEEANTGDPVKPERYYYFDPESGALPVSQTSQNSHRVSYLGAHLLSLSQRQFIDDAVKRAAKHIMRAAITWHLGDKTIKSRALFQRKGKE